MKKFTEEEKEELKAKIEAERIRTHQAQLKRGHSKNKGALLTSVLKGAIGSSSYTLGSSLNLGLVGAVAVSGMENSQGKGVPLRRIKLNEAEKEALKRKIEGRE